MSGKPNLTGSTFSLLAMAVVWALSCTAHADDETAPKAIDVAAIRAADHLADRRYAVVIGINDFRDRQIADLTTCEDDARAIHQLLTNPQVGGVDPKNATLLLGNKATFRNIRKALADLRQIPADATVFIYFSGHGAKEGGDAYWITQDAELANLAATAMPDRDVRAFIDRIPSKRVVVMLDCCYAAATIKGGKTAAAGFDDVLKRFTGKGRAYLMAAGSGEEAIEAKDLKQSVFTHYLVEGLAGAADTDTDGVVVLTELATYIDRHVADEARLRGGVQRPVVQMEDVAEPSRFALAIDADRLAANQRTTAEARALRAKRLAAVESLYFDEKLTLSQTQLARRLLNADTAKLDAFDRQRLKYIQQVADGKLAAGKLQRALDLVESPAERRARLAREAAERAEADRLAAERAERARQAKLREQRQARIAELLSLARVNDSKANGRRALEALSELLRLDPNHGEAKRLRAKIAGYYGPTKVGETVTNSIGMKLTYIPAGEFVMGSPRNEAGRDDDETQHRVRISRAFLLGTTEVTQGQYRVVMGESPSGFKGSDDLPVEQVSWEGAVEFCRKLSAKEGKSYRLPTESEWEYACRAGTTTAFHFGDRPSTSLMNYDGNYTYNGSSKGVYREKTVSARSFKPNGWGLYNMHGNVREWCSDWYGDYPTGSVTDPGGASTGEGRVLRGGSWYYYPQSCRAAFRFRNAPDYRYNVNGFRVVCVLSGSPGLSE